MPLKILRWVGIILTIYAAGPLAMMAFGDVSLDGDWQAASRDSAGIAPHPAEESQAVVQVYAGRAFRWRGVFGVHTWIATKEAGARQYIVHQVLGWRARHGGPAISQRADVPDRHWFGSHPELLADLRGPVAAEAIVDIYGAIRDYPYTHEYRVWPGPNSNTFTAHITRTVPALQVDFPPTAIGKDYLPGAALIAAAPSGTGAQMSVVGALGLLVALEEGIEVNLLGLTLGIDPLDFAIKLPGVGRFGAR